MNVSITNKESLFKFRDSFCGEVFLKLPILGDLLFYSLFPPRQIQ